MRNRHPEPQYLAVGRVTRPHGVRGELRVEVLTDDPEHLASLPTLYLGEERRQVKVLGVRLHQKHLLVTLDGCDSREAADELRGLALYVAAEDAVPLERDEYYEYQVEGLQVVTENGEVLGEIAEVFTAPGANDVFIVHGPLGEMLIPAIEDVVIEIDPADGRVVIRPMPGLLPDRP